MRRIRTLFLYGLALFFILALSKNIIEYQKNLSFYKDYKKAYEKEKKTNSELRTNLVKAQDGYEFEKTVRNKLNLQKEGEAVMIIPEPTPTILSPTPTMKPNYQQWVDVFSGR